MYPRDLRRRFWVVSSLAVAAVVLAALTLAWRDWIEIVFGVDPDSGSGALEWTVAGTLAAAATLLSMVAIREWRREAPAAG
jgi:hypothetical protein